jgi:hypothetical protein
MTRQGCIAQQSNRKRHVKKKNIFDETAFMTNFIVNFDTRINVSDSYRSHIGPFQSDWLLFRGSQYTLNKIQYVIGITQYRVCKT